jgi:hypothetical protein
MAGRLGGEQTTVQNLFVQRIDTSLNLIFVKGSVPGPDNGFVLVRLVPWFLRFELYFNQISLEMQRKRSCHCRTLSLGKDLTRTRSFLWVSKLCRSLRGTKLWKLSYRRLWSQIVEAGTRLSHGIVRRNVLTYKSSKLSNTLLAVTLTLCVKRVRPLKFWIKGFLSVLFASVCKTPAFS